MGAVGDVVRIVVRRDQERSERSQYTAFEDVSGRPLTSAGLRTRGRATRRRNSSHIGANRQAYRDIRPVDRGTSAGAGIEAGDGKCAGVWTREGAEVGGLGKRVKGCVGHVGKG